MNSLDRLILGHNQFFGVSHFSAERGAERDAYFEDVSRVLPLLRHACSLGVRGLMLSTHERAARLAEAIRTDAALAATLHLHILLPYMAKYVRAANEKGAVRMVGDLLGQAGWAKGIGLGLKAGMGLLRKDQLSMMEALIDLELAPFRGLPVRSVFLHNALTDLAVGWGAAEPLRAFVRHIRERHGLQPGFCTLSGGAAMKFCREAGLDGVVFMASFNPIGFQMNPSREACERALVEYGFPTVAMSVLAAGQIRPAEAAAYLSGLRGLTSVIAGASSASHLEETFGALRCGLGWGE